MPLPDSYYEHLDEAEKRLAHVKEKYAEGKVSVAQIEVECRFVELDLRAASTILSSITSEEIIRDREYRSDDFGPI